VLVGSYYIVISRSVVGSYDLCLDFLAQNVCVEWLVSSRFRRRRLPLWGSACVCVFRARFCVAASPRRRPIALARAHDDDDDDDALQFLASFLLLLRLRLLLVVLSFFLFFPPLFSKTISMTIMHKERRRRRRRSSRSA